MRITRQSLFSIIEKDESGSSLSRLYDILMLVCILLSLAPLTTRSNSIALQVIDKVTCIVFIIDYIFRWITEDLRSNRKGIAAFARYPFTVMAVIDILSILPSLSLLNPAFKVLRVSRLFRIFRVFKFIRYYEPLQIMLAVIKREGRTLLAVLLFAVFYILICALVMFNVESAPFFETFYDAVYWACCTLTTVGYGDIYPVSNIGRAFSMISAIVGIALIALPSGIITSGYMEELRQRREEKAKEGK